MNTGRDSVRDATRWNPTIFPAVIYRMFTKEVNNMGKAIDLTGQRFGRLTVIERAENDKYGRLTWKCECDCGKNKIVNGQSLIRGKTKSCGCLRRDTHPKNFNDLTGKVFGRWTVIEKSDSVSEITMWKCRCSCGNERVVSANNLTRGKSKSCGCYYLECLKERADDLVGKRFTRLTVKRRIYKDNVGIWECECDCGNIVKVSTSCLKSGHTKSCGCYSSDLLRERVTTHGMTNTRLYNIWCGMKDRCNNPNSPVSKYYGGKGINICKEWESDFHSFCLWASETGYTDELTIERVDVDKGYSPDNCKWVTKKAQQNNKSTSFWVTINKEKKTLAEWCEIYDLGYQTVYDRIRRGWDKDKWFKPVTEGRGVPLSRRSSI